MMMRIMLTICLMSNSLVFASQDVQHKRRKPCSLTSVLVGTAAAIMGIFALDIQAAPKPVPSKDSFEKIHGKTPQRVQHQGPIEQDDVQEASAVGFHFSCRTQCKLSVSQAAAPHVQFNAQGEPCRGAKMLTYRLEEADGSAQEWASLACLKPGVQEDDADSIEVTLTSLGGCQSGE